MKKEIIDEKDLNKEKNNIPEETVAEEKSEGLGSKFMTGIKKHGKKVAGVAALGLIAVASYALGRKNAEDESAYLFGDDNSDVQDIPEVNFENGSEE